MGNSPSSLRTAVRFSEKDRLTQILDDAGGGAAELINNDYSQDCILQSCQRSIGNTLYYGVTNNRKECVRIMLERGADVHSTGYMEETCLHCAVGRSHVDLARLLVQYGGDLYSTDDLGRYPIHSAAGSKNRYNGGAMIRYLAQEAGKSEDVKLTDYSGRTPLHIAVLPGNLETVQTLVELGSDLNAQDKNGNTPLHNASNQKHIFDFLIEKGADSEIENSLGRKPRAIQS